MGHGPVGRMGRLGYGSMYVDPRPFRQCYWWCWKEKEIDCRERDVLHTVLGQLTVK